MSTEVSGLNSPAQTEQEIISQLTGTPEQVARGLLAAAEQGYPEAQALYAQLLLDGQGVDIDQVQALYWFKTASLVNHAMAINMVGRCLENGWGVVGDPSSAAEWYERAAELGLDWGMYNYANLLARGQAIPQNRKLAFELYNKAASQGHAKSMNIIGRFIEEGWEAKQDLALAADWYRRSAEAGDFRGQFNHASRLAEQGKDIEAAAWLRQCASTATLGFKQKMAQTLLKSGKAPFVKIAAEILAGHGVEN
ncbi:tetratricopeptide repeat protein [Aquirhabdus sp.]|uniref:tetratricopeptide repeat protein n=1 Tax=Aquirhabdus sp. TaxID=2824160 RepID=UPI00396CC658